LSKIQGRFVFASKEIFVAEIDQETQNRQPERDEHEHESTTAAPGAAAATFPPQPSKISLAAPDAAATSPPQPSKISLAAPDATATTTSPQPSKIAKPTTGIAAAKRL
jgi:hypothetical protein